MQKQLRIFIVGAGAGGTQLLKIFYKSRIAKVIAVCDIDAKAPGLGLAKGSGMQTYTDCGKAFSENPEMDIIINASGSEDVQERLLRLKPEGCEVVAGHSAKLLYDIVDEHEKIREKVKEKQILLSAIMESVLTAIVIIDAKTHKIVDLNPKAADMIGLRADEIKGKVCHNFICPAEVGKCPITDLGQRVDNSERLLIKGNGERVNILKTAREFSFGGNRLLVDSFVDITEQKKSQEDLLKQNKELERINKLMVGRELKMKELKSEIKRLNGGTNKI
jgi:PAS domain S-box-containing protein